MALYKNENKKIVRRHSIGAGVYVKQFVFMFGRVSISRKIGAGSNPHEGRVRENL